MRRRFTVAELLMGVTFVALVLAIAVSMWRRSQGSDYAHRVIAVEVSADGSTLAALCGKGLVFVWDSDGTLKATLPTRGHTLALSCDGRSAVVTRGSGKSGGIDIWDVASRERVRTVPTWTANLALSPAENLMAATIARSRMGACRSVARTRPKPIHAAGAWRLRGNL